jgi:hypothetical protein
MTNGWKLPTPRVRHGNLLPTIIDEMSNEVGQAYVAMPDRLYLVDEEGLIAYRSGPGPFGFKSDEFEEAITAHMTSKVESRRRPSPEAGASNTPIKAMTTISARTPAEGTRTFLRRGRPTA